jgi:hypothetical protein
MEIATHSNRWDWTPKLAYAVGLIATDGNLSRDGRHITLTSADKQQLENFRDCLDTKARLTPNPPGSFSKKKCYRIQLGNKALYQKLQIIGLFPNKTSSLKSLRIPRALFRDFLRGVIDGDGSIILYKDRHNIYKGTHYTYVRTYVTIVSASLHFLAWIQASAEETLCVRGSIHRQAPRAGRTKPIWKLRFAKQASMQIIPWIYYNDDIPCLTRKKVLAERALQTFLSFQDKRKKAYAN